MGSGNVLPMFAGLSAVLEAASSAGAMVPGSTGDQPWGETLRGPALVGMAEPALCVPFLGTFTAQAGTGSRSGIWGTRVPRGAGVGLLSCLPPSLAAGVGWDGGRIQIRSGSGGAE